MSVPVRVLLFCLTASALTAPAAPAAPAAPLDDSHYRKLEPAQPTASPGRIEVLEFFSYACPHCNHFFPLVSAWAAQLPADVVFRRVPVGFNRPQWIAAARAYYALAASGDLDRLDGPLFHALHEEQKSLFDEQSLADWVGRNGGHADKFADAYTSFAVNSQTVQADRMAENYEIEVVPTLAVNGRYIAKGDSFAQILANTDALIAKVRAESAPSRTKPRRH